MGACVEHASLWLLPLLFSSSWDLTAAVLSLYSFDQSSDSHLLVDLGSLRQSVGDLS